jgi:hypothetical protein
MRTLWIENYAGTWDDEEGRTLLITIHDDQHAIVDLLVDGIPMLRPWCDDAPALGLPARYRPGSGPGLDIDLGRAGFCLGVNYEVSAPPDPPESLSVSLSRSQSDVWVEQFIQMFGKLGRYRPRHAAHVG